MGEGVGKGEGVDEGEGVGEGVGVGGGWMRPCICSVKKDMRQYQDV